MVCRNFFGDRLDHMYFTAALVTKGKTSLKCKKYDKDYDKKYLSETGNSVVLSNVSDMWLV